MAIDHAARALAAPAIIEGHIATLHLIPRRHVDATDRWSAPAMAVRIYIRMCHRSSMFAGPAPVQWGKVIFHCVCNQWGTLGDRAQRDRRVRLAVTFTTTRRGHRRCQNGFYLCNFHVFPLRLRLEMSWMINSMTKPRSQLLSDPWGLGRRSRGLREVFIDASH